VASVASSPALAARATKPTVPAGFEITKLADAPNGASNCDDLAFLDGQLFMGCQNKTLSIGGGGDSTLVEYTPGGALVKTWSVKDKIDGMNADPLHHRLIVTENEDAHSHLFTLAPSAPAAQQIVNYTYSPDPRGSSTPVALRTGGGTDQVSVDSAGAHSHHRLACGHQDGHRSVQGCPDAARQFHERRDGRVEPDMGRRRHCGKRQQEGRDGQACARRRRLWSHSSAEQPTLRR
jgi:hypothetical protein